jgi:hypothetical protein
MMVADEEDKQLTKGEARHDAEIEHVHEHGVQDRHSTQDTCRSAARQWCKLVGVRMGTGTRTIAIATWWDDKGRVLSLAALNPFAGNAILR